MYPRTHARVCCDVCVSKTTGHLCELALVCCVTKVGTRLAHITCQLSFTGLTRAVGGVLEGSVRGVVQDLLCSSCVCFPVFSRLFQDAYGRVACVCL
jgi:hypothetical protein